MRLGLLRSRIGMLVATEMQHSQPHSPNQRGSREMRFARFSAFPRVWGACLHTLAQFGVVHKALALRRLAKTSWIAHIHNAPARHMLTIASVVARLQWLREHVEGHLLTLSVAVNAVFPVRFVAFQLASLTGWLLCMQNGSITPDRPALERAQSDYEAWMGKGSLSSSVLRSRSVRS